MEQGRHLAALLDAASCRDYFSIHEPNAQLTWTVQPKEGRDFGVMRSAFRVVKFNISLSKKPNTKFDLDLVFLVYENGLVALGDQASPLFLKLGRDGEGLDYDNMQ